MIREIEGHDLAGAVLLPGPAVFMVHVTASIVGPARRMLCILVDGDEVARADVDAPEGSVWPVCLDARVHLHAGGVLTFRAPSGLVLPHFRCVELPIGDGPDDGWRAAA